MRTVRVLQTFSLMFGFRAEYNVFQPSHKISYMDQRGYIIPPNIDWKYSVKPSYAVPKLAFYKGANIQKAISQSMIKESR